jgi:hypothetical protein
VYHRIVLAREYRGEEALECWNDAIPMHKRATSSLTCHRRPPAPEVNAQSFINQVGMLMYAAVEHYSDVAKTDPKYTSMANCILMPQGYGTRLARPNERQLTSEQYCA